MKENFFPIALQDAEKYARSFEAYIPAIVPVIEKYNGVKYSGGYYDHNVIPDLRAMPDFQNWDATLLMHFAYTTNSFVSYQKEIAEAIEFENRVTADGYVKATDEILNSCVGTPQKFYVILKGHNLLGGEVKKVSDGMLLKNWSEQGLHWMNPRAKRKGYRAFAGQFIKQI